MTTYLLRHMTLIESVMALMCNFPHDVQAMGAMNKQMNMPALMNIMREFERQNERMEMTSDMMGESIDDAFEVRACQKEDLNKSKNPKTA